MPLLIAGFPCCRSHDLCAPIEEYPLAIQRTPGDEVYWFGWRSSFHGKATIRIAKFGEEVVLSRVYRPSEFRKSRLLRARIAPGDWSRLEDAVIAANFWMLDTDGGQRGLDGSTWMFAGRRRHDYHYISRWSPGGKLRDLGRFFFYLAGLGEVRLY
jgi:hypothetical protein